MKRNRARKKTVKKPARKTVSRKKVPRKKSSTKSTKKTRNAVKKSTKRAAKKSPAKKKVAKNKAPTVKTTEKKTPSRKTQARRLLSRQPLVIRPSGGPKRRVRKLTPGQKKKYTDVLLSLRSKIARQISFLSDDSLNTAEYDLPRDGGTEDFDREFALSLLSSEQDVIFQIDEALRRVELGVYAQCEECGGPIGKSRMEAVPFAKMCIECKSNREKGMPRFHPLGDSIASTAAAAAHKAPLSTDAQES
jgi:DnaK suppressor protein